jgi:hypothetical protein
MDRRIYGPRVIAAVVPRYFKNVQALQIATGMAYSTLNDWANGHADPRLEALDRVVEAVKKEHAVVLDPLELLGGPTVAPKGEIGNHPEWRPAVEEAQRKRPGKLPPAAYAVAAHTAPAKWPAHIDWTMAYELADFWHRHSTDDALAAAETAEALAEMAAEDARVEAGLRRTAPANRANAEARDPGEPPAPAKPRRRKAR